MPARSVSRPKITPSLMEEVRRELGVVSQRVEEVSLHYVARLQREIAEIVRTLEKKSSGKSLTKTKERELRHLLDLAARLQINPQRGRRKDLKKLDALIGEFQVAVEKR